MSSIWQYDNTTVHSNILDVQAAYCHNLFLLQRKINVYYVYLASTHMKEKIKVVIKKKFAKMQNSYHDYILYARVYMAEKNNVEPK